MPLTQLLSHDRIVILPGPCDRARVLEAAAQLLAPGAPEQARVISQSLNNREALASTAIGHGVAIPHGRIAGAEHIRGAFLRLDHPTDFGAADGALVDLVLAMAVPEHFVQQHLQQLAELAERFANSTFRQRLREARNARQLARCLLAGDLRQSAA